MISKDLRGEPGMVYYFNIELVHSVEMNGESKRESWLKSQAFTLNPKFGNTIERNLRKLNIPKVLKDGLISKRIAEMPVKSGRLFRIWISETQAPTNWGNDSRRILNEHKRRDSSIILTDF